MVGGRLGEMPSQGYTLFDIPTPQVTFVHVHPGAEDLGRVYRPHLAIHAAPTAFAASLEGLQPPNEIRWRAETEAAHADYLAWTEQATSMPGAVNIGEIVVWLREHLPPDAIITVGAGNLRGVGAPVLSGSGNSARFLGPTSGSMGYGVPAAVGAKRLYPERTVVAFAGDGYFLMNGQEFATAVQHELPVIVIVVDNGMYGTIRMHQERDYPGRVSATALNNPDFAAYARAFGGFGATVEKTADFAAAFEAAQSVRQAGDHPRQDRSGGDHAGHDHQPDPREGPGRPRRVSDPCAQRQGLPHCRSVSEEAIHAAPASWTACVRLVMTSLSCSWP